MGFTCTPVLLRLSRERLRSAALSFADACDSIVGRTFMPSRPSRSTIRDAELIEVE